MSVCPTAADYVGDSTWAGSLVVPAGRRLCRFARMFEPIQTAHARKRQLVIPEATYPVPLETGAAPFRLPMCLAGPSGPAILEGTVEAARRQGPDDIIERYWFEASMPVTDGSEVTVTGRLELAAPVLDLGTPEFGAFSAAWCVTEGCFTEADDMLHPCDLPSRMCDEIDFEGGTITIDSFHWAGQVGAGFASPSRLRGSFRGVAFDIDEYDQMTLAYGHHAFTRELLMFFDHPIEGVCGLHIAEVTEFGVIDAVELVDCAGQPMGQVAATADRHVYGSPCPL